MLTGWYSDTPEVQAAASARQVWVGFYYVADAVQAVSAFLLRRYRIIFMPLALYGVGLWGLGLFDGYQPTYVGLASYESMQTAKGFWATSTVAIALVAGISRTSMAHGVHEGIGALRHQTLSYLGFHQPHPRSREGDRKA